MSGHYPRKVDDEAVLRLPGEALPRHGQDERLATGRRRWKPFDDLDGLAGMLKRLAG
jgi:hypothetical protein